MDIGTEMKSSRSKVRSWYDGLPHVLRDFTVLLAALCGAYYISTILLQHTGVENNSALVFTLAVAVVST